MPMTFDEYDQQARQTDGPHQPIVYPTLGLVGEAGEVAEQVKRIQRDDGGTLTTERWQKIIIECGDVLWYLASVLRDIGSSLDAAARANLVKIADRKRRGVTRGEGDNR